MIEIETPAQLCQKKCLPCEGGVQPLSAEEAQLQVDKLPGWTLTHDAGRIRKEWTVRDFLAGLEFFHRVADLAESERHHPDLHLTSYRSVTIEIWTHAIGRLSQNDFILAAKIDQLPITQKVARPAQA